MDLIRAPTSSHYLNGTVPFLPEEVEVDDDGAAVVIVFPLAEDEGGVVALDEDREDAWEEARRIFYRPESHYPDELRALEALQEEEVSEGDYQEAIRSYFKALLQQGGLLASSSPSIDGDEVFLKISLASNHEMLKAVAEHWRYKMPVRTEMHDDPGPLRNKNGAVVPAYTEFEDGLEEKLEPFRQVDEIRLVLRWLTANVCLEEMQKQGVITRFFPAASYEDVRLLNQHWAKLSWSPCFPSADDTEDVRKYFGERIGFFFAWFGSFNRQLTILTVAAGVASIRRWPGLGDSYRRWVLDAFAVFLVGWMASFNEIFKRRSARLRQLWGMEHWDNQQATTRVGYNPDLEGTQRGEAMKIIATCCVLLYAALFGTLIIGISMLDKDMRDNGDLRLKKWSPYITSILMKVCSFTWSKLASRVVALENHRTTARFNDSLAWTLACVKLFVALFPFASLAFLESWVNYTCGDSLPQAALEVYRHVGWPMGTSLAGTPPDEASPNATQLGFLDTYKFVSKLNQTCIYGCYPQACWVEQADGRDEVFCNTNCWESLSTQLVTFYLLQLASALAFLVIPILIVKVVITLEMAKVSNSGDTLMTFVRMFFGGRMNTHHSYSFIQFQAKCHAWAPYEYGSWGGSYTEDFLELAIGYSLLACFGLVVPEMTMIGLASQMVLYRILAFRMLNVTSRPWPSGAEGIGNWQYILETICTLAVTCNVGLATFVMSPIRYWNQETKFLFFILAEKLLFSLQTFVDFVLKDEPDDVIRIGDFNADVEKELTTQHLHWAKEVYDFQSVDFSIMAQHEAKRTPSTTLAHLRASKRKVHHPLKEVAHRPL